MTAKEARELTDSGGVLNQDMLDEIREIIKIKASVGFSSCTYHNVLGAKPVIEVMKSEGYECELINDNRDGDYWQISW